MQNVNVATRIDLPPVMFCLTTPQLTDISHEGREYFRQPVAARCIAGLAAWPNGRALGYHGDVCCCAAKRALARERNSAQRNHLNAFSELVDPGFCTSTSELSHD